ncbi:MAG: OadG family protein [Bacteroidales bacterium]|nr:OadG family protein [Bacteroidales bacterium]
MNNFEIPIQLTIKQFDLSAIDSDGLVLVIVGYCIVFMALLLLYLFFRYIIPSILRVEIGKNRFHKGSDPSAKNQKIEITGEVNAAISMALYLYLNELHDEESNILTIKRVSKVYSPWSSKIYGVR